MGITNPYKTEELRQKLAEKGKFPELIKTYSSKYPEIKNLNRPKFWDEIYSEDSRLKDQDGMTKDRIATAVGFIPGGKLKALDIGAGLGWVEELIGKDSEKEIYANDFSPVSVKYLRKNFKGNLQLQSVYNLKYPENFFDVVLALEIIEHVPPSKIFKVLKSISRILKQNGTLIVSVPLNEGLDKMKNNPSGHVRMYTENLIKVELKIAGFEIIKCKKLFAFGSFYNLKTFIAKIFKTHSPNNIVLKTKKI
ncbi:MAG: class I SAM-dependent methyltransferase [Candidatus Levybacteria bacterium]|nr:class I SAM-dependent methyltransferase [Candidatus Levybacteria bacterium]